MSIIWVQESLSLLQRLWNPSASAIFGYIWERFAIVCNSPPMHMVFVRASCWSSLTQFDAGTSAHKTSAGFPWPVLGLWRWSNAWGSRSPCGTRPPGSPEKGPKALLTSNYFTTQFISWFSCFVSFNSRINKICRRLILMNWNESERIEKPHILSYQLLFLFAHM